MKTRIPHVILGRDCLVVWVYGGGPEMSMIVSSHATQTNPDSGWVTLSTLWQKHLFAEGTSTECFLTSPPHFQYHKIKFCTADKKETTDLAGCKPYSFSVLKMGRKRIRKEHFVIYTLIYSHSGTQKRDGNNVILEFVEQEDHDIGIQLWCKLL